MKKKLNFFQSIDKMVTEIPVSEIMVRNVLTLKETDTVRDAIDLMAEHSISGLIITDHKSDPVAIVSEGDIIKKVLHKGHDLKKTRISQIMTRHLFTIKPTENIGETAMKITNKKKMTYMEEKMMREEKKNERKDREERIGKRRMKNWMNVDYDLGLSKDNVA